jgi:hypothetical protein
VDAVAIDRMVFALSPQGPRAIGPHEMDSLNDKIVGVPVRILFEPPATGSVLVYRMRDGSILLVYELDDVTPANLKRPPVLCGWRLWVWVAVATAVTIAVIEILIRMAKPR